MRIIFNMCGTFLNTSMQYNSIVTLYSSGFSNRHFKKYPGQINSKIVLLGNIELRLMNISLKSVSDHRKTITIDFQ